MSVTIADLTPGTVVTLTEDHTHINNMWARRPMGVHFILGEVTSSGWMVRAFNTARQRWDALMLDQWVLDSLRIVGRIEDVADED